MPLPDQTLRKRDAQRDLGQELLESVRQMRQGQDGHVHSVEMAPSTSVRLRLKLSQQEFADLLGVSVRMVQGPSCGKVS